MSRPVKLRDGSEIRRDSSFAAKILLARRAKRAGMSRREYVASSYAAIDKWAAQDNWRSSEKAATKGDVELAAFEVWGPV